MYAQNSTMLLKENVAKQLGGDRCYGICHAIESCEYTKPEKEEIRDQFCRRQTT